MGGPREQFRAVAYPNPAMDVPASHPVLGIPYCPLMRQAAAPAIRPPVPSLASLAYAQGVLASQMTLEAIYERFHMAQPPSFRGATDPIDVEEWMSRIELIFDMMQISDREKVSCVVFMLNKNTRYW